MGWISRHRIFFAILAVFYFEALSCSAWASHCPQNTGVYNSRNGVIKSLMAFNILENGKLFLVTRETGMDGAMLEIDGEVHSLILANGKHLDYMAYCDQGVLSVSGVIDGQEFEIEISDDGGGKIVTSDASGSKMIYSRAFF